MTFEFNTTIPDIDIWIENNLKLEQDLIRLTTQNVSELKNALKFIETEICTGKTRGAWGVDLSEEGKEILKKYQKVQ